MTIEQNSKASAWDLVGSLFWEVGRVTARPSAEELSLFLAGIPAGSRCVVVGASTKTLVEMLIDRGTDLTVLDFSERMCADLRADLPARATVRWHDITRPAPDDLAATQDFVLSDRLFNRFSDAEAAAGLGGMIELLRDGGQIRTSVKLGLYPMDERMIALGRERGSLARFFDESRQIIDFSAAGDVLTDALVPHGQIPSDILLAWYRGRGREQRFDEAAMAELLGSAFSGHRMIRILDTTPFPHAPTTTFYIGEVVAAARAS